MNMSLRCLSVFAVATLLAAQPVFGAEAAPVAATPAKSPPTSFKFQFGPGPAAPGYTLVSPTMAYSKETGYGFEANGTLTAAGKSAGDSPAGGAIASDQPFTFAVAVPEGNYRVTVALGAPDAASNTTVKTETRRLMLENIPTEAGKFSTQSFTANVRIPAISTGGEVNLSPGERNPGTREIVSPNWDDKLTIRFSGTHPAVSSMEIKKVDDAVTVFVLGDSTVTDQPSGGSWGQMLPRWFKPEVAVANHALSGETLRGFLKERRWDKVLDLIKPGDYVLIQFGTNDSKNSGPQNIYPNQDFSETYAAADTTYKDLLKQFAADAQKKGAYPVIISPPARRGELPGGRVSLEPYATAAMLAAKESNAPGIDLNAMGLELNAALGADAARSYADQTHTNEYGAYIFARCIILGIQQNKLPLAKYLVDGAADFDPKHPQPLPDKLVLPSDGGRGGRGGAGNAATGARGGRGTGRGGRGGGRGTAAPADTSASGAAAPAATAFSAPTS